MVQGGRGEGRLIAKTRKSEKKKAGLTKGREIHRESKKERKGERGRIRGFTLTGLSLGESREGPDYRPGPTHVCSLSSDNPNHARGSSNPRPFMI